MSTEINVKIPFMSTNFNNINIELINNQSTPCNRTCDANLTQISNYNNTYNTFPCENDDGTYCATVSNTEIPNNENTFLYNQGNCNPNTCFFNNDKFVNKLSRNGENETLKNCCNSQDADTDFCYHNLNWSNSCNTGQTISENENMIATKDKVYLPWVGWAGGQGFQQPGDCDNWDSTGASGRDLRWCGPTLKNKDIDWDQADDKNHSPSNICEELYGRTTHDLAYILNTENKSPNGHIAGNIMCGPLINSGLPNVKDRAVGVCGSKNKDIYGSPGNSEHKTSPTMCVNKDSTPKPYESIVNQKTNNNVSWIPSGIWNGAVYSLYQT